MASVGRSTVSPPISPAESITCINSSLLEPSVYHHINWSVKQLDLNSVKQVNIEDIKYLRYGQCPSRMLGHWTYPDIFEKLNAYCEEQGVLVQTVNPTYTSQRCSVCGWVLKSNRKGKKFKCKSCGFATDSDLNASSNIALPLPEISKKQRLRQDNKTGFYWLVKGQKPIVSVTQKT